MRKFLGPIYILLAICIGQGAYFSFSSGKPILPALFSSLQAAAELIGWLICAWALFYVPFKFLRHRLACRRAEKSDGEQRKKYGADSAVVRISEHIVSTEDPRRFHFLEW
jgi:hypothetical protein